MLGLIPPRGELFDQLAFTLVPLALPIRPDALRLAVFIVVGLGRFVFKSFPFVAAASASRPSSSSWDNAWDVPATEGSDCPSEVTPATRTAHKWRIKTQNATRIIEFNGIDITIGTFFSTWITRFVDQVFIFVGYFQLCGKKYSPN